MIWISLAVVWENVPSQTESEFLHCNTLQHTATRCNALQHIEDWKQTTCLYTAAHARSHAHTHTHTHTYTHTHAATRRLGCNASIDCNYESVLQSLVTHCNTRQQTATYFNTLPQTATNGYYESVLQSLVTYCNTQPHTATYFNTLPHTATNGNHELVLPSLVNTDAHTHRGRKKFYKSYEKKGLETKKVSKSCLDSTTTLGKKV